MERGYSSLFSNGGLWGWWPGRHPERMENSLQVCPEINFCLYFLSHPPTEGLATEGACGAITVTGAGQGLDLSWSGVTRAAGDTARRTSILAASVSVMTPCVRIMTYSVILCTYRGWVWRGRSGQTRGRGLRDPARARPRDLYLRRRSRGISALQWLPLDRGHSDVPRWQMKTNILMNRICTTENSDLHFYSNETYLH